MIRAYVGLGSNLDQPQAQICRALLALCALPDVRVVAASPLYGSAPWGDPDQPDYVNAVVAIDTELEPPDLLACLLTIERAQGRTRTLERRNGPRTLDLDLLICTDRVLHSEALTLPHPRLHQRPFVLLPLLDLAPDLELPGHGLLRSLLTPEFASLCWRLADAPALAPLPA